MYRPRHVSQLAAALAVAAVLLSACSGGSSSPASAVPESASPASGTPASGTATPADNVASADPVDASENTVTYGSAIFETMSSIAIEPNCQSPTTYLSASYSAEDFSCSLTLDRASLFDEVCASKDSALVFTNDPEAGICSMTSDNLVAVKAGCDAIVGDNTVTATFDDATASCILTVKPESIISGACDPATVDPLEAQVDATGLTCTLSLTAPVVYEIIAQAVTSGDINCKDGSPRSSPSEACVLEALDAVKSKP
jgi:hypothetical protein